MIYFGLSKNVLRYKLMNGGDQGIIISIDQEYIAIGNTVNEIKLFVEYDENTVVFNEKWRKIDINELKVGDFIEVHSSEEFPPTLPSKYYGEVILILEKK